MLFHNTGPNQLPGLIVMELDDHAAEPDMDRHFERVVVLVNANDTTQTFGNGFINDQVFALHPIQQGSADSVVRGSSYDPASGAFTVPGRTTAVFVTYDEPEDMIADLIDDVDDLIAAGVLNDGQGNALTVKLEQALSQLAAGKEKQAINALTAFINQVQDFAQTGVLPEETAAALIAEAELIITRINAS